MALQRCQKACVVCGVASGVLSLAVAFSPDGKHLATASHDHTAQVYVPSLRELLNLARSRVTRPFTADVLPVPNLPALTLISVFRKDLFFETSNGTIWTRRISNLRTPTTIGVASNNESRLAFTDPTAHATNPGECYAKTDFLERDFWPAWLTIPQLPSHPTTIARTCGQRVKPLNT